MQICLVLALYRFVVVVVAPDHLLLWSRGLELLSNNHLEFLLVILWSGYLALRQHLEDQIRLPGEPAKNHRALHDPYVKLRRLVDRGSFSQRNLFVAIVLDD